MLHQSGGHQYQDPVLHASSRRRMAWGSFSSSKAHDTWLQTRLIPHYSTPSFFQILPLWIQSRGPLTKQMLVSTLPGPPDFCKLSCPSLPAPPSSFRSCFLFLFVFWLHWVFMAARGLSSRCGEWGCSLVAVCGFSSRWLLLVQSMGSRFEGFSSCGSRA